ncbi:TRAP transporter small permease [Bacteroidota bacterium]
MRTVRSYIISFLENGLIISVTLMLIVVMIQVIARFMLPKAPAWTEEAARFCFIFSIAFGGGLGIRNHAYVRLEWLLNKFPDSIQKNMHAVIFALISILSIVIAIFTVDFVEVGKAETSPALLIPMNYIFASIFFLFIFIALFSIEGVIRSFKEKAK